MFSFSVTVRPDHELFRPSCFRFQVFDDGLLIRGDFYFDRRIEEFKGVTGLPFTMGVTKVVLQYVTSNASDREMRSTLRVIKVIVLDDRASCVSLLS
jgi:hypothetical protein